MNESLNTILPGFIDFLKGKGRSPATILAYRADLGQLVEFIAARNKATPSQVNSSDIEGFRDYLLAQKYTPKSVSRKLNAVKTFFGWLTQNNIVSFDPSKTVSHPKLEAQPPKFLSPLEYRALRDTARSDIRIATIIELILQTGMRISEIASLKKEHVKEESIIIAAYATQTRREIPLNQIAKNTMQIFLQMNKNNAEYIFVSKNGKPLAIRNIRAMIDRYFQKAEVPQYSVNDLRTTFVIENLKRGVDLVLISQVTGHKRISTTQSYLELAGVKEPGKKQKLEEL